jgi:hypothetical protein
MPPGRLRTLETIGDTEPHRFDQPLTFFRKGFADDMDTASVYSADKFGIAVGFWVSFVGVLYDSKHLFLRDQALFHPLARMFGEDNFVLQVHV